MPRKTVWWRRWRRASAGPDGTPRDLNGHQKAPHNGDRPAPPANIEPAHVEVDEFKEDLRGLQDRARIFLVASLSITMDLAFVAMWFALTKLSAWAFTRIGTVPGVGDVLRTCLEVFFDGATLTVVVTWVVKDVIRSVKRIWKKK